MSVCFLNDLGGFDHFLYFCFHDFMPQIGFEPLLDSSGAPVHLDHAGLFDQGFSESFGIEEEFLLCRNLDSEVFNIILDHFALDFLVLDPFDFLDLLLKGGKQIFGFSLFSNHVRVYEGVFVHHVYGLRPNVRIEGTKCNALVVFVHRLQGIFLSMSILLRAING